MNANYAIQGASQFISVRFLQRQGKMMKQGWRLAKHFNAVFAKNKRDKPYCIQFLMPQTAQKQKGVKVFFATRKTSLPLNAKGLYHNLTIIAI